MMALRIQEETSTAQHTVLSYHQQVAEDRNTTQVHLDAGAELLLVPRWLRNE